MLVMTIKSLEILDLEKLTIKCKQNQYENEELKKSECQKWGHSSKNRPFYDFCLFHKDMIMFPYDFFHLDKFSSIPKIFHNFILFYRILSYWNHVNKRVVDEFFKVLDLEKHYICWQF